MSKSYEANFLQSLGKKQTLFSNATTQQRVAFSQFSQIAHFLLAFSPQNQNGRKGV